MAPEAKDDDSGVGSTLPHAGTQGDVWVFAYGSLMWRPDFTPLRVEPARLYGWRRSMCILSTVYRGTDAAPGLVLGLDRGGSCLGRALLVGAADWPEIRARLDGRELITGVYRPRFLPVRLGDGGVAPAYAYVVDPGHWQYWRGDLAQAADLVRQGHGRAGSARDYLARTVANLDDLGIRSGQLHRLLAAVDATT